MSRENIRVVLRVRPLNNKEISKGNKCAITFLDKNTVSIENKIFNFDAVLPIKTTQEEAFQVIGMPIVDFIMEGFNGTIFAYGQTSSGKTHTMIGHSNEPNQQGLIPRIVNETFNRISKMKSNVQFVIKIEYLEIYMEKIRDLFDCTKDNLPICENKYKVPFVKNSTERYVSSAEEVLESLEFGAANRSIASTNMNILSSRSHTLLIMSIISEHLDTNRKKEGKIYLIDLAGSEKVGKTGAEGQTLDEAKMINKSLSTLGNVINALVENHSHIPYRDSKLTRILQNSIGGNSKTTLIVCCSPDTFNVEESRSSMFFGTRAKSIKNVVKVNEELTAEEFKLLYESLQIKYKKLLSVAGSIMEELKKWRKRSIVPEKAWISDTILKTFDELGENVILDLEQNATQQDKNLGENFNQLYKDLDQKDEEINNLSTEIRLLKDKLDEETKKRKKITKEIESNELVMIKYKKDLETSKNEVQEILMALEELAQNYDQKSILYEKKNEECDKLHDEINNLKLLLSHRKMEEENAKGAQISELNSIFNSLNSVMLDLIELCKVLNPDFKGASTLKQNNFEAEFASIKLFISKLNAYAVNLRKKLRDQDKSKATNEAELTKFKIKNYELESSYYELKAKYDSLKLSSKELIKSKKSSDDAITILRSELNQLEAKINVSHIDVTSNEATKQFHQELEKRSKIFTNEINFAKIENEQLETEVTQLRADLASSIERCNLLETTNANNERELERLNTNRRTEFGINDSHENARRELKDLEENVCKELQTLHNLRKLFVGDLKERITKVYSEATSSKFDLPPDEDKEQKLCIMESVEENCCTLLQNQKINFLQVNLDNLLKMHKQLVRENSELKSDIPKLEKRLKAIMDRVKQTETALKDTKEASSRDKKRYQLEIEKLKEQFKNRVFKPTACNILRPIMAGTVSIRNPSYQIDEE